MRRGPSITSVVRISLTIAQWDAVLSALSSFDAAGNENEVYESIESEHGHAAAERFSAYLNQAAEHIGDKIGEMTR